MTLRVRAPFPRDEVLRRLEGVAVREGWLASLLRLSPAITLRSDGQTIWLGRRVRVFGRAIPGFHGRIVPDGAGSVVEGRFDYPPLVRIGALVPLVALGLAGSTFTLRAVMDLMAGRADFPAWFAQAAGLPIGLGLAYVVIAGGHAANRPYEEEVERRLREALGDVTDAADARRGLEA